MEKISKSFCTTYEAANILGVSLRTVQLWAESGLIACWKTQGGHRRIPRESIDRLLHDRSGATAVLTGDELVDLGASRLRILITEDDPALLRLYRLQLAKWSIEPEVMTANNGFEALVRIGNSCPDLLITDLGMPNLDGFGMLKSLRTLPELDEMEIVVVSGLDAKEIAAKGGIPSDIPLLPKPVPFKQLEEIALALAVRLGRSTHPTVGSKPPIADALPRAKTPVAG